MSRKFRSIEDVQSQLRNIYEAQHKLGRNDPCWCGSLRKFKKCHGSTDDSQPIGLSEFDDLVRRDRDDLECMAPAATHGDCLGGVIKSHSLSRAGQLASIAEDGHVVGSRPGIRALKNGRVVEFSKIGLNIASTFSGFCHHHDSALFAPLDRQPFEASAEQTFLLFYRTFCREHFLKEKAQNAIKRQTLLEGRVSKERRLQAIQHRLFVEAGTEAAIAEGLAMKAAIDQELQSSDYSRVSYVNLVFDQEIPVACSGMFSPPVDLNGSAIQDVSDISQRIARISLCMFNSANKGHVVLMWHKEDAKVGAKLAVQMNRVVRDNKADFAIKFAIEYLENVFLRPSWWEGLAPALKEHLTDRAHAGLSISPWQQGTTLFDGPKLDRWKFAQIRTNVGEVTLSTLI